VKPGIAEARYSEFADTTSSSSRAKDGVDGLAVAAGEAFQSQDLEAGDDLYRRRSEAYRRVEPFGTTSAFA